MFFKLKYGFQYDVYEEVAANQALSAYTNLRTEGYRGRPRTGLPGTPDADRKHIGMRLKTRVDLEQLCLVAKTLHSSALVFTSLRHVNIVHNPSQLVITGRELEI